MALSEFSITDVETRGDVFMAFIETAGAFKPRVLEILAFYKVRNPQPGHWYPLQSCLDACRDFYEKIGKSTLFMIGKKIPEVAVFPPYVKSFEAALGAIDIAYHMNHRLKGKIMYDQATNIMLEGIGHYYFQYSDPNARKAMVICDNPYPCDFDRGLIEGMARRFKPNGALTVKVEHDLISHCRKSGGGNCRYIISW